MGQTIDVRTCDEQTAFAAHRYLVPLECMVPWDPSSEEVRLRRIDVGRVIDHDEIGQQAT